MLSCFNPKHLAVAGSLLASVTFAASAGLAATPAPTAASGTDSGAASSASGTVDMSVARVQAASPIPDPYSRLNWLVIQVDFQGKVASRLSVINDVSVTLSVAWASTDPKAVPPVELTLTSTARFVGLFPNRMATVLFFIPPETLARSSKGIPFPSTALPDFYAVQFKVGDNALPLGTNSYSNLKLTSPEFAKSFVAMAANSGVKGLMFTEASVPSFIRDAAMSRLSSNYFPTYVSEGADAGH